jgi:membrane protein required for colicin V production
MHPIPSDLEPTLASFTAVDWVLLAILAWSVITAFLRGLIRELFALAGLFLGILMAGFYYLQLAAKLGPWVSTAATRQIVAFLTIALGIMILAGLLGRLLRRTASLVGLGIVDRLLGALFGLARGCLVGVALMMSLSAFLPPQPWLKTSVLVPYFLAGAHGVSFVVPQHLQQQITDGVSRFRH